MIRTIVYPHKAGATQGPQSADNIPDKLIKYIPGEVVALYTAVYALAPGQPQNEPYHLWVLVLCLFLTFLYFLARADKGQPPRLYFYVLAVVAFFAWALGTSTVGQDVFQWPDFVSNAAIPTAVITIPLIDEALTRWLPDSLQWP